MKRTIVVAAIALATGGCTSPKTPEAHGSAHASGPSAPNPATASASASPPASGVSTPPANTPTAPTAPGAAPSTAARAPLEELTLSEHSMHLSSPPKLVHVLRHAGNVTSLTFDPTGASFASGCADHKIRLWSADKGRLARTFADHRDVVTSVAFRFDGTEILSGSLDGTAKAWDAKTGRRLATTAGPEDDGVSSVAYSNDGHWLALGGANGRIVMADRTDEAHRFELAGHAGRIRSVVFAHRHDWLLSSGGDGVLALWDASQQKMTQRIVVPSGAPCDALFTPDDEQLVTCRDGPAAPSVVGWDSRTAQPISSVSAGGAIVSSIALSDDGRILAIGTADGVVQLWAFKEVQKLAELRPFKKSIAAIAFSAGSKYVVAGGDDRTVAVWQLIADPSPPKEDKACLERCRRRSMNTDCADEEGHMMPCPCRCP